MYDEFVGPLTIKGFIICSNFLKAIQNSFKNHEDIIYPFFYQLLLLLPFQLVGLFLLAMPPLC